MYNPRRSRHSSSAHPVYAWVFGVSLVWWILVGLFHAYDPFRSYLQWWNVNPVNMIALNLMVLCGIIGIVKINGYDSDFNAADVVFVIAAIIGLLLWVWNGITFGARSMIALRAETYYVEEALPITITDFRPSAFAEAQVNFNTQNPDARYKIGGINYVNDVWVAEYGPKGFFNRLRLPSTGFYKYDPRVNKNAEFQNNVMPFAVDGVAGNSLKVLIAKRDPFAYFDTALWVKDNQNEGSYMLVVSLAKRRGFNAVPYVSNVVLIHKDGRTEWLTPDQAKNDERLDGIQIMPEWLEAKIVNAYGYTHGVWDALFYHTDQVQVQVSSTSEENKPPFHMRSSDGMYWVTPISPYQTPSFVGLVWQNSKDVGGPVHVWRIGNSVAYPGVDALSATIKNAPGHPGDIKWLINNSGTLSGEQEILEMLPVGHDGELYFIGYAALGTNPQKTRFYPIIRASDQVVMENLFTIDEVNTWLSGQKQLSVLSTEQSVKTTDPGLMDLSGYSTQQLWELLNQVINEIQGRGDTGGAMVFSNTGIAYRDDGDLRGLGWDIIRELVYRAFN